jgi:hypothetical protein
MRQDGKPVRGPGLRGGQGNCMLHATRRDGGAARGIAPILAHSCANARRCFGEKATIYSVRNERQTRPARRHSLGVGRVGTAARALAPIYDGRVVLVRLPPTISATTVAALPRQDVIRPSTDAGTHWHPKPFSGLPDQCAPAWYLAALEAPGGGPRMPRPLQRPRCAGDGGRSPARGPALSRRAQQPSWWNRRPSRSRGGPRRDHQGGGAPARANACARSPPPLSSACRSCRDLGDERLDFGLMVWRPTSVESSSR